jgi:hypothetical protein
LNYELPYGVQGGSYEARYYLAGEEFFEVEELEVYNIII